MPVLSIVIPTYKRLKFLERAVRSCLDVMQGIKIEILIIPNGTDLYCLDDITALGNNIYIHPIAEANANIARNYGLSLAKGKYIRFLDDDDYLLPHAKFQLDYMESNKLEYCVGYTKHEYKNKFYGTASLPEHEKDLMKCVFQQSGLTLTTGNLYLKECLEGGRWDIDVPRMQDHIWMINICILREWKWNIYKNEVAVWCHHEKSRISDGLDFPIWFYDAKLKMFNELNKQKRLNSSRRHFMTHELLRNVHVFFPEKPIYCSGILIKLMKCNLDNFLYISLIFLYLIKDLLFVPYRFIKHKFIRNIKKQKRLYWEDL